MRSFFSHRKSHSEADCNPSDQADRSRQSPRAVRHLLTTTAQATVFASAFCVGYLFGSAAAKRHMPDVFSQLWLLAAFLGSVALASDDLMQGWQIINDKVGSRLQVQTRKLLTAIVRTIIRAVVLVTTFAIGVHIAESLVAHRAPGLFSIVLLGLAFLASVVLAASQTWDSPSEILATPEEFFTTDEQEDFLQRLHAAHDLGAADALPGPHDICGEQFPREVIFQEESLKGIDVRAKA